MSEPEERSNLSDELDHDDNDNENISEMSDDTYYSQEEEEEKETIQESRRKNDKRSVFTKRVKIFIYFYKGFLD